MAALPLDAYLSVGLTREEYEKIVALMGRTPTQTELGMFGVMWSEHCGYKYSKTELKAFSRYREAMEGSGLENAGVVDIGDNLGVVMKVESHNHPSAVEPYQGAATGVGGIIRDIFTMGARPIAALNSLRFGTVIEGKESPEVVRRNRYLMEHVVAGIGGYGNCVGVPTVAGEVMFHPRYSGNPLVNAMCVGLVELDKVTTAGATGVGNPVVYLGSATGRDGIQGATFASEALGEDTHAKRPNVQIGDPFAEKQLIEATLEALETGAVVAIQDMGAAGLTCSTIEMASKGGVGMEIDLDLVPMRESDMDAYELMLSESQERMLCVCHKGREQEVVDVFHKWEISAVVIGSVTEGDKVKVSRRGIVEAEVVADHLAENCPVYSLAPEEPESYRRALAFDPSSLPKVDPEVAFEKLLGFPDIADKSWVTRQYDQQVQNQTAKKAGAADAAVIAPRGTKKGLSLKIDGNGRYCFADPYVGGMLAVAEACRNVACTGAQPVAATDGLNFGNPQQPTPAWQFRNAVRGIAQACEALGTPVVSGNVSFYNQSALGEVLPTPLIGILGIVEDATQAVGSKCGPGSNLFLVRYRHAEPRQGALGASAFLAAVYGSEEGVPTPPDLPSESALHKALVAWVAGGLVEAAHDVSDGGLAVCLAEMTAVDLVAAEVSLPPLEGLSTESAIFGEWPGWVVVASPCELAEELQAFPGVDPGIIVEPIGRSTLGNRFVIRQNDQVLLDVLTQNVQNWHKTCFDRVFKT